MQTLIAMAATKVMRNSEVKTKKTLTGRARVKTKKTVEEATGMKTSTEALTLINQTPGPMTPENKQHPPSHLLGCLARQIIPGCGHNCIGEIRQQTGDEYLLLFFKGVGRRGSIWLKRNEFEVICQQ